MLGITALIRDLRAKVIGAMLVISIGSGSQAREPNLEELEMEYLLDQASRAFEKRNLSIEQISADFRFRCLRAIGSTAFCDCLVEKRPYVLRFEQYVGISSRTRSELNYDTLNDNGREIVDKVFAVRDECVAE